MIDGLKDSVHAAVGDEDLGDGVGEDGLLRHPRQNQHILGDREFWAAPVGIVIFLDVVFENHSLRQSFKGGEQICDHFLWNGSRVEDEAHCKQDNPIFSS